MSGPSITLMQKHIPNVVESKINSIGHNFGKEKTVQDIKSTKLLMILNLVNSGVPRGVGGVHPPPKF